MDYATIQSELARNGFAIIGKALNDHEVSCWISKLETMLNSENATIKNSQGAVYAARNLLEVVPDCRAIAKIDAIARVLSDTLGADCGLVRGLYFDKHPDRTWSLPLHKDLTIAVKDNALQSQQFTKPTTKSGVPHVEAPQSVLERMLTLRIHLDPVTNENGPLQVATGSHVNGKQTDNSRATETILVEAGDVLAMRPLLSHASGSSQPGTTMHRRILHLEFAADRELADGYQWYHFMR